MLYMIMIWLFRAFVLSQEDLPICQYGKRSACVLNRNGLLMLSRSKGQGADNLQRCGQSAYPYFPPPSKCISFRILRFKNIGGAMCHVLLVLRITRSAHTLYA